MESPEKAFEQQIQFARHNFENHQALIRFSDAKAGVMITLLVFLAASGLQIIKEAVSVLLVGSCIGLVGAFLRCLWSVQAVLRPRGARYYGSSAPGTHLLWQEHVVAHGTNDAYSEATKAAAPELLLKNLTDQVFELAHISREKMAGLHKGRRACWFGF
ncbi:MAG TPA: hypothetical protein VI488_08380 [Candidatus Angelobacter sp.]